MRTKCFKLRQFSRTIFFLSGLFYTLVIRGSFEGPFGPWETHDIGATGSAGNAVYTNGTFIVRGAGEDHWTGTADALHYTFRSWTGDCAFVIRVSEFTNSNAGPKAGIMFRATLDPGSKNAFLVFRPGGATGFQYRLAAGGQSMSNAGDWINPPYWLKLIRRQNTLSGYYSTDGVQWTLIGSADIEMPETIFIGLAVNSNQYGSLRTAAFDNLQIFHRPETPTGLTALRGFDGIHLFWSDNSTNETGYRIERRLWTTNFDIGFTVGSDVTNYVETFLPSEFFRVKALGSMDSDYSDVATPVSGVLDPVPQPWQSVDIGTVGVPGCENFRDGVFRIGGSGSDIGGVADEFHYVYQAISGDGEIVGLYPGNDIGYFYNSWGKGGLMFRQGLEPDSANVFFFLRPGGNGPGIQMRTNAAANTDTVSIPAGTSFYWVRLTRTNNVFSVYMADQNLNWIRSASQRIEMTDPILVGMAVTSHTNSFLQISSFPKLRFVPLGGSMEIARRNDNAVDLLINGMFGRIYGIDASTNLLNWTRLTTQTNTTGTIPFTDTTATNYGRRFYRTVLVQ